MRSRTAIRARPTPMIAAILFFATVGLLIAAYTTYVHYAGFGALLCVGGNKGPSTCQQVQSSEWNNVAGIPVSVLGLVGYGVLLASLRIPGEYGRALGFGTALIGFLFSMYLTYREAFSLHEYCEWCLGSAACMTVLMVLTGIRFLRTAPGTR